jgi:tol-pal system protein YbgF
VKTLEKRIFAPLCLCLGIFVVAGCVTRGDIHEFKSGLQEVQADLEHVDSLSMENQESIVELRALLLERLNSIESRIEALDAKVGDTQGQLQKMYKKIPTGIPRVDTVSTSSGSGQEESYNLAYLDYSKGEFDLARREFEAFLADNPTSELADNALYWIGECHVSLGQLEGAVTAFKRVATEYPNGNKAPSALYKLGMLYLRAGQTGEAERYFEEITMTYPDSEEAGLARERLLAIREE